ncbi:MAG: sigma-54 dependent transcriptional regulator [Candidatus Eisenbacteria bacterium]
MPPEMEFANAGPVTDEVPAGTGAADVARILVVDDEALMRSFLDAALKRQGHAVRVAATGEEALEALGDFRPDLALLDIRLGGMDGLDLLLRLREVAPECAIVMMTAHGTVETAVEAMKRGAADFLLKPFTIETLEVVLTKVLGVVRLREENRRLRAQLDRWEGAPRIVGTSAPIRRMIDLIRTLAQPRATVLVFGESGTGKELVARALHAWGPRSKAALIKVNCAALPAGVMESELFGHERGAFTGANQLQRGKFELAHGGTLLLDEVSEMDIALQPKLLRILQEQEFYRVGGSRSIRVDVRLVATTNADLEQRVRAGRFREDLLYRLLVVPVRVPPLRERREDIPLLARHFLARAAQENGKRLEGFSQEATGLLMKHPWPGNVRQLENLVERAVVLSTGGRIEVGHLVWDEESAAPAGEGFGSAGAPMFGSLHATHGSRAASPAESAVADYPCAPLTSASDAGDRAALRLPAASTLDEVERACIFQALEAEGGNKTRAARRLGISVRTVRNKLGAYQREARPPEGVHAACPPAAGPPASQQSTPQEASAA